MLQQGGDRGLRISNNPTCQKIANMTEIHVIFTNLSPAGALALLECSLAGSQGHFAVEALPLATASSSIDLTARLDLSTKERKGMIFPVMTSLPHK